MYSNHKAGGPHLSQHQTRGTSPIGLPVHFVTGQFAGQTIRAELEELQKADLGRKFGSIDRRPLDPPISHSGYSLFPRQMAERVRKKSTTNPRTAMYGGSLPSAGCRSRTATSRPFIHNDCQLLPMPYHTTPSSRM